MASMLHFGGHYRAIFRNALPLLRHFKSGGCAQAAVKWHPHARIAAFASRCFSTESVHKKLVQDPDLIADGSQYKKLDRALYRLDMDVRRRGRISLRDVKDIFNEIKSTGNPSSTQCLLLIRCCGSLLSEELLQTRSNLVDDIWKTLEAQGVVFDVSHYNAILKVYLDNEHQFLPTEFLANMQAKGIEPNRVTYQRLIAHYCQKGDIGGASKILEFMKEKDLPINENVFNALIQGHARANDMENAKSVLEVMRNAKLDPGPDTYTQLLCGYAEKGDFDSIKATMKEMKTNDIHLLDRDYLDVIYALAVNGSAQHADELIPHMHKGFGYNQDVVNVIMQLVNNSQEETAYKLLLTMPRSTSASGDPVPVGQFFIRHLVKMRRPEDKILQICNDLKQRDLNAVGILRATEAALVFEYPDYALHFLESLKGQDVPIRPHYFWPVLVSHRKSNDEQGIYDTVKLMTEMDAMANFDTLLEYVYPALNLQDPSSVVLKLKEYGLSVGSIVGPLVTYLVMQKDLKTAVQLFKTFPVRLTPNSLTQPLAHAYQQTGDLSNVLQILIKINSNLEPNNKTDWTGHFLLDFIRLHEPNLDNLQTLLEGFKSKGLGISRVTSENVHRRFKHNLPKNISALLEELSISTLGVTSEDFESGSIPHPREMSVTEMENHLIELKSKNMNTRGILRRLLLENCRLKNLTRAMEIRQELDELNFVYSPAMLAQLMGLHVAHDQLTEALNVRDQLHQMDPEFSIDDYKILNLATLMVKMDLLEDAIKLITEHYQKHGLRQTVESLTNNNWKLLNAASEKGNVDNVKRLFDLLLKCGCAAPVNMILGALVKVHLVNDDLPGALAEYENCCKTYHNTPWKNELFIRLIKLEDAERLQKVVDLSTEIHGEMNTMYDLAFAFIEGDQFRQAKKIFETPGFRARSNRLEGMCERLLEEDKIKHMEQLVLMTRDIFDVDRDRMYYHLIRAYAKVGDAANALSVWTTMQEENIQPSDHTLQFLGKFLQKNGQPVPFAIPQEKGVEKEDSSSDADALLEKLSADEAMNFKRRMEDEGSQLSVHQSSTIMGKLLADDRVNEALNIAKELFQKGSAPQLSKLRILMQRLSAAGDVENIIYVGNNLTEDSKRKIAYNNVKGTAYINGGQHLELLDMLEAGCPENHADVPKFGLFTLMNKHPELVERVETLAKRYAQHNYHATLNVLWQYYFIKGEDAKAEDIYKSAPWFQEKLHFFDIIKEARLKNDELILHKLLKVVKTSSIQTRPKGILYSALIDLISAKGNTDEALKMYNEAIELGLSNSDFNEVALLSLQRNLIDAGKPVPFNIIRQTDSSSSSSDSDSDSAEDERK